MQPSNHNSFTASSIQHAEFSTAVRMQFMYWGRCRQRAQRCLHVEVFASEHMFSISFLHCFSTDRYRSNAQQIASGFHTLAALECVLVLVLICESLRFSFVHMLPVRIKGDRVSVLVGLVVHTSNQFQKRPTEKSVQHAFEPNRLGVNAKTRPNTMKLAPAVSQFVHGRALVCVVLHFFFNVFFLPLLLRLFLVSAKGTQRMSRARLFVLY